MTFGIVGFGPIGALASGPLKSGSLSAHQAAMPQVPAQKPAGPQPAPVESPASDGFNEIRRFVERAADGGRFTPKELLTYQMKVASLSLRVELVSKVAESANATVRRFQNAQ